MLTNITDTLNTSIPDIKKSDVITLATLFDEYKDSNPSIDMVILFGSIAEGYCTEDSDIDIVIVGKNIRKHMDKITPMLIEFYKRTPHNIDILYADSIEQMQEYSSRCIVFLDVLKEGKIIWQDSQQ
jgi:predicted nucleotidyltransferase